jgi:hypothetical protein
MIHTRNLDIPNASAPHGESSGPEPSLSTDAKFKHVTPNEVCGVRNPSALEISLRTRTNSTISSIRQLKILPEVHQ